jgi:hypothetical protein
MEHPALGPDRRVMVTLKQLRNVWFRAGWRECEPPPKPILEDEESTEQAGPTPSAASSSKTSAAKAKKPAAKKPSAKEDE